MLRQKEKKFLALHSLVLRQGSMGFLGMALGALGLGSAVALLAVSGWFLTAAGMAGLCLTSLHGFNFLQPSALIRLFAITRTLALYGERIVSHDGILRLLAHLRLWLFDALARRDGFRLARLGSGELMQRMLADIDLLDQWPLRGLAPWVWAICLGFLFLLLLFFVSPSLAWRMSGILAFLFVALPTVFIFPALSLSRILTRKGGERRQFLLETLAGLITLRTTGGFGQRLEKFWNLDQDLFHKQWGMQCLGICAQLLILLLLGAGLWLMVLYGGMAVQEGLLSPALLVACCCALLGLVEVMIPLAQTFQSLGFTLGAKGRLEEAAEGDGSEERRFGRNRITGLEGDPVFCLSHVHARQEGAIAGPDGVSFCLKKGDSLRIDGPSGCGKTTLAAVMGGWLQPLSGKVLVNGVSLEDVEERCLRRYVGLLDQSVHLFPLSLEENLRLARPDAEEAVLWEVLEDVRLGAWATTLPQGLKTVLGEYGVGLSGGQARRLALARLLLMETPILILDEPFEGLDAPTAQAILVMLQRRQRNGILVVISHRTLAADAFTHHHVFAVPSPGLERPRIS